MPGLLLQQTTCSLCAQPTTRKCARCKTTFYCSRAHQRKHWSTHSVTCIPAPRRRVVWGISLPAFHLLPELVPVVVNEAVGELNAPLVSTPELEEHLGGSKYDSRIVPLALLAEVNNRSDLGGKIYSNGVGAHKIRAKQSAEAQSLEEQNNYYIRVFFRDAFRSDGSPLNRSVRMLCGARLLADGSLNGGATPLEWCGNLLVMRCMKRDGEERYLSATRADIEAVREWLGLYQRTIRGRETSVVPSQ